MDFDAQLYVSFKSSKYLRVALEHMLFNFHFLIAL